MIALAITWIAIILIPVNWLIFFVPTLSNIFPEFPGLGEHFGYFRLQIRIGYAKLHTLPGRQVWLTVKSMVNTCWMAVIRF